MASRQNVLPPVVLIVDDDLGFLVWLGLTLGNAGFVTVPAASSSQAEQEIDDLDIRINLAILNGAIQGIPELVGALKQKNMSLKVIAIQNSSETAELRFKADASHSRSRLGWVSLARRTLGMEKASGAR